VTAGGRLYALGGWDGAKALDAANMYDPAKDAWRPIASLPAARAMASAVWLRDRIYLIGGHDGSEQRAEMWTYDPAGDTWQAAPGLVEPRAGLAVGAEGTSIYAIGGGAGDEPSLHERFDLNTQTWSTIDSPRLGPWHHAVGAIIGPNLHVVGGWSGDFLDAHEAYQASHLLFLPIGAQGAKP
jgi:N-acetylneuraminic acid mutarotase